MSSKHIFNEEEVYGISGYFKRSRTWLAFKRVHEELGFKVRVTGGAFLTHEIDCTKEDFETILDLI